MHGMTENPAWCCCLQNGESRVSAPDFHSIAVIHGRAGFVSVSYQAETGGDPNLFVLIRTGGPEIRFHHFGIKPMFLYTVIGNILKKGVNS